MLLALPLPVYYLRTNAGKEAYGGGCPPPPIDGLVLDAIQGRQSNYGLTISNASETDRRYTQRVFIRRSSTKRRTSRPVGTLVATK
jgi:hypothetical protein